VAQPLILIPARLQSTRLPRKVLSLIGHDPMIVHVWRQACAANIGSVVVVCDCTEVAQVIKKAGGQAVITSNLHPTGSDRLNEALSAVDPQGNHDIIINLQGDLPFFPSHVLQRLLLPFEHEATDMATFVQFIEKGSFSHAPVHVLAEPMASFSWLKCVNFTRNICETPYKHVGIYAFRRHALTRFAQLNQTEREKSESLEQLRALEHHFFIAGVLLGQEEFSSVDTWQDLQYVREKWAMETKNVAEVAAI
jgi:3-deoxy-manno-octulosonate cytidylyltransferase (CMP-KDO synthetase)